MASLNLTPKPFITGSQRRGIILEKSHSPESKIPEIITHLKEKLKVDFSKKELLLAALTRPSVRQTHPKLNNIYEKHATKGDKLLLLVATEYVKETFPEATTKQVKTEVQKYIQNKVLAEWARSINLEQIIVKGPQDEDLNDENLGDHVEGLLKVASKDPKFPGENAIERRSNFLRNYIVPLVRDAVTEFRPTVGAAEEQLQLQVKQVSMPKTSGDHLIGEIISDKATIQYKKHIYNPFEAFLKSVELDKLPEKKAAHLNTMSNHVEKLFPSIPQTDQEKISKILKLMAKILNDRNDPANYNQLGVALWWDKDQTLRSERIQIKNLARLLDIPDLSKIKMYVNAVILDHKLKKGDNAQVYYTNLALCIDHPISIPELNPGKPVTKEYCLLLGIKRDPKPDLAYIRLCKETDFTYTYPGISSKLLDRAKQIGIGKSLSSDKDSCSYDDLLRTSLQYEEIPFALEYFATKDETVRIKRTECAPKDLMAKVIEKEPTAERWDALHDILKRSKYSRNVCINSEYIDDNKALDKALEIKPNDYRLLYKRFKGNAETSNSTIGRVSIKCLPALIAAKADCLTPENAEKIADLLPDNSDVFFPYTKEKTSKVNLYKIAITANPDRCSELYLKISNCIGHERIELNGEYLSKDDLIKKLI